MTIILLRGFSHSGKDYIGQILCNKYGYKRFAFADSLKMIIQQNFKCAPRDLHTQEGKLEICEGDSLKRTHRQILIDEGLHLRNIDAEVFARHCCSEIYLYNPDKIVITDWRYLNELAILKQAFPTHKIIPVHVIRTDQNTSPVDDISEHQLDDRYDDYILLNNMNNTILDKIELMIDFIKTT